MLGPHVKADVVNIYKMSTQDATVEKTNETFPESILMKNLMLIRKETVYVWFCDVLTS